jgi:RNA 3'-terminal phosphate cyclase (ATP)
MGEKMTEIDGGQKSGSGTIVRDAVPYSILMGEGIRLYNIRTKRDKPGLRPQHLKAMEAAAQVCGGFLEGGAVGSKEIRFEPGEKIKGGSFRWDIGTAGSTSMLALCVIPLALFADEPSVFIVTGGLFQDFAPSLFHLKYVLLPVLRTMGAQIDVRIIQPGYVPRGGGMIEVKVLPVRGCLEPFNLSASGRLIELRGIALSSMLAQRRVSERMANACDGVLRKEGYAAEIEVVNDSIESPAFERPSPQPGAALAVWARTDTGCLIGADMAGAPRRSAEFIGETAARMLLEDLDSRGTTDRHLADQIIPFAALAKGRSTFLVPRITDHVEARLWLVERILKTRTEVQGNRVSISGIGYERQA